MTGTSNVFFSKHRLPVYYEYQVCFSSNPLRQSEHAYESQPIRILQCVKMLLPDPDDALDVKSGVKDVFRFLWLVEVLIDKVNFKRTILTIFSFLSS